MLEQQDSSGDVGGGVAVVVDGCGGGKGGGGGGEGESEEFRNGGIDCDGEEMGRSGSSNNGDVNNEKENSGESGGENGNATATTTVRIHTTYKKRASKFMNRPNVQNGLGAHPLLHHHPYGSSSSNGGFGGGGTLGGGGGGGRSRLFSSNYNSSGSSSNLNSSNNHNNNSNNGNNGVNSLISGGSRNHRHHRSLTTRNSIFGGGNTSSSGGGFISPHNDSSSNHHKNNGTSTTASSTTTATTVESRPPFVTTVTRGRFLPSKFDLMVEKSLFTFSSRPKPVGLITKHQCSLSGPGPLKENSSQNCQPRGAHDYFNVMWDPHIYRGTTTTLTSSLKQPDATTDLSSSRDQQDRYRRRRAFLQGSQNTFNNSTNTSTLTPIGGVGGGGHATTIRSNRYRMTTKVTSRSRTFPPPEGRHQVHVQTEEYLEDLSRDVIRGPEVDAIVQTDPIEDEELLSSPLVNTSAALAGGDATGKGKRLPVVAGVDASTQVLPGELITFDERVQPVVEVVVGKILEQSLLETMEEEEIGALKAQQNRFLEKRKEEERELKRLQEQQERISAEKERLKRHLEIQLKQRQLQQNGDATGGGDGGTEGVGDGENDGVIMLSEQNTGGGNNGMLSTAYLLELLPSVLNSLRQEGFLMEDQSGDDVLSSYAPLWQQSSTSSKPDEDNSTSVNNNNNNDDEIMMTVGDDGDADNYPIPQDGYQSRMNSLEIAAATNPIESSVELQESLATAMVEEEREENGDAENSNDNCDPSPEVVDGGEGGEGEARVEEIKAEDREGKTETEVVKAEEEKDDIVEGDADMTEAEETSPVAAECEESESQEQDEENKENVAAESGEGEKGADIEESGDQPEVDNSTAEEDANVSSLAGEESEEKIEEEKADEEKVEEKEDETAEDETGKLVDENATTDNSPDAQRPLSPLSSSQKLPNGAIPNVL